MASRWPWGSAAAVGCGDAGAHRLGVGAGHHPGEPPAGTAL